MAANTNQELSDAAAAMRGLLDDPHATPAEEPKKEEIKEEKQDVTEEQNLAETEEVKAEQDSEESEETEPSAEAQAEDADEDAEETIQLDADQFAQLLGTETDDLIVTDDGEVRFRTKVNGQEGDATLSDVLKRYQTDATLTNRGKKLAESEKQLQTRLDELTQANAQFAQRAAITLEAINAQYESELGAINWDKLKDEDPGAFAVKKTEMRERKEKLDALTRQTLTELDQAEQQANQEKAKLLQTKLAKEQQSMQEGFKALGVKVDSELEKGVVDYLNSRFTEEQLNQIAPVMPLDELSLMAYKAMQFEKGKATAESKKVKKVPKVLKSGKKPSTKQIKAQQDREIMKRHKKEGSMDSAIAAMKGRIN
jgi:hypothetical protein